MRELDLIYNRQFLTGNKYHPMLTGKRAKFPKLRIIERTHIDSGDAGPENPRQSLYFHAHTVDPLTAAMHRCANIW